MEKITAIVVLGIIALTVLWFTEVNGLDVVTNVVCTIGGLVTGQALAKMKE